MNVYVINFKNPIPYQEGLDIQQKVFDLVDQRVIDGALLILEHTPVLTMGIRTLSENLLVTEEYLQTRGVELHKTDRGGDITFHGPGQIVAYPILRFRDFNLKLSEYMHMLEDVIISTLDDYGIDAYNKDEFPGVWIQNSKVCAIGVRAKKFIVYHGLAFNVHVDKNYFSLINPCGITQYKVSSMNDFTSQPDIEDVKKTIIQQFNNHLNVVFQEITLERLLHLKQEN
jgi:lipoyl(octanoyl) transferase